MFSPRDSSACGRACCVAQGSGVFAPASQVVPTVARLQAAQSRPQGDLSIMSGIRRALCRWLHGGYHLRRSIVGGGALECWLCHAGFVDLADAGLLDDPHVNVPRPGTEEPRRPEFVPTSLTVRQGGKARTVRVA